MSASFDLCYQWVLPHEAGTPPQYKINPDPTYADPNAQVCAGINSAAFPEDFARIAALPIDQRPAAVEQFYQRTYWNANMDAIASNEITAYLLDSMVNQGQRTAVKLLQGALLVCEQNVALDGILGPATVTAANSVDSVALLSQFQRVRANAYRAIGGPNLQAWLARAALTPPFA